MSRKSSPVSIVGPLRFTESPGRHRNRRSKRAETAGSNLGVPVAQSGRSHFVVRILYLIVALLCFTLFRGCFATCGVGSGQEKPVSCRHRGERFPIAFHGPVNTGYGCRSRRRPAPNDERDTATYGVTNATRSLDRIERPPTHLPHSAHNNEPIIR
ncbi:hypothetical protein MTO96_048462 [Rhipicephalus appendiculatus]